MLAVRDAGGVWSWPGPTVVAKDFTERGVRYEVRYFIREFERRDLIAGDVQERIWYALGRIGVQVPAPLRTCLLYTSPSPRDRTSSRMPSAA